MQASSRRVGQGKAIAGIVLGVVGLILCIAYTASFVNHMGRTSSTPSNDSPSYSAPSYSAPTSAAPATQPTSGQYGSQLAAGDLVLTVSAPEKKSQAYLGSQVCATVTYRNTGSTPESFGPFDWKFRTAAGVESSASIPFNSDNPLRSGTLAPGGGTVSGEVCGDDSITDASAVVYSPGLGIMYQLVWQE